MSDLIPVVELPLLYVNGCQVTYTSATTLTMLTGQCRDSTDTYDITVNASLVISTAVNGVNGLDTGTVAINTWYAVYAIFDPTNNNKTAGLISTSSTAPLLPSVFGVTYGAFRLLGYILTDGSANILKFYPNGSNNNSRRIQWDAPIRVLNAGAATSVADVSLATAVPPANYGRAQIQTDYVPHAAADTASVKPKAATAYTFIISGIVASVDQTNVLEILPSDNSGAPTVSYVLSSGTSPAALTLYVTAFELNL